MFFRDIYQFALQVVHLYRSNQRRPSETAVPKSCPSRVSKRRLAFSIAASCFLATSSRESLAVRRPVALPSATPCSTKDHPSKTQLRCLHVLHFHIGLPRVAKHSTAVTTHQQQEKIAGRQFSRMRSCGPIACGSNSPSTRERSLKQVRPVSLLSLLNKIRSRTNEYPIFVVH